MVLNRQIASDKIQEFLDGHLSGDELHQWAFTLALSDDYSKISSDDPLLGKILGALFGLKITTCRDKKLIKELRRFQKCLAGQDEFIFVDRADAESEKKSMVSYLLVLRIYVVVFAVTVLFLQMIPLLKIALGLSPDASAVVWRDAVGKFLPHLAYSLLLIMPLRRTARGWRFYPAALIFLMGLTYYWWTTVLFVMKLYINMIFVLVFLPFGALPATLALVMLIIRKVEFIRYERQHRVSLR